MKTNKADNPLVIGIAGLGTVGCGLLKALRENADVVRQRVGRDIVVKKALVRDAKRARAVELPPGLTIVTDYAELADDSDIELVVELMGGIDAPLALIDRALDRGKHIVTANKALLAEKGAGLFTKAAEKGLALQYEASVAGGIPIVQTLRESLAGNRIRSLVGILNGTSNYILSEMTSSGLDFASALADAGAKGYAEADPSLDIDGHDAAHKLVLLIRLAWGVDYPFAEMPIRGIRNLDKLDIAFAREFGYRIKLLGMACEEDGKIEAGVFPMLVHHTFLLARVGGAFNAVRVEGNAVGSLFMHGRGAGDLPTASAVLGDVLTVARQARPNNTGFVAQNPGRASIFPPEEARSCYYMRAMVQENPGVLRDLAGALAQEGISIAQVIQKSEEPGGVPLVLTTHEAEAKSIRAAARHMQDSGLLRAPAVYYRILGKSS